MGATMLDELFNTKEGVLLAGGCVMALAMVVLFVAMLFVRPLTKIEIAELYRKTLRRPRA